MRNKNPSRSVGKVIEHKYHILECQEIVYSLISKLQQIYSLIFISFFLLPLDKGDIILLFMVYVS